MNEDLKSWIKQLAQDADSQIEQRDQANEDMRFINVPGGQWEDFLETEYKGRAKLEFDIVSNYKNRFIGEWNQNRMGVEFKSQDGGDDSETDLLNGMYRADFRDNLGKSAQDNAADEQATCGYSAFGLSTQFIDEENPEDDEQKVIWRCIHNAHNTVFFDQSARREDKLDARWVTELTPYNKEAFEEQFPDIKTVSAYIPDNKAQNYTTSKTQDVIYIATRYEIEKKKETVFIYKNIATKKTEVYTKEEHELVKDELKKSDVHVFSRERKVVKRHVLMSRFTGEEVIEEQRAIAGKYLPIIPIYGYRAYVDGVEYYHGLVRKFKDAGRAWNVQMSQLVENSASSGQEVPIFLTEQMQNSTITALWADKNNKPYLLVDPVKDDQGNIVASGPIGYNKPAQLDASTATLMQVIPDYIRQVTGGVPQDTIDPNMSGKALNAMLKRENMNTQILTDNLATAVAQSGDVWLSMAEDIYTSQRMVTTLGRDGTESSDTLYKVVADEETGLLVEVNTLKGKFKAYADAAPQYETLREQTVEDLNHLLDRVAQVPALQEYIPPVMSTILENTTGVGLEALKKLNRKNMLLQGLVEPKDDEEQAIIDQASQPKEDPQKALVEAAAIQQKAEAKNLEAASIDKVASAEKKTAETEKILTEINSEKTKNLLALRDEVSQQVSSL